MRTCCWMLMWRAMTATRSDAQGHAGLDVQDHLEGPRVVLLAIRCWKLSVMSLHAEMPWQWHAVPAEQGPYATVSWQPDCTKKLQEIPLPQPWCGTRGVSAKLVRVCSIA